ncbi:hypothetical protein ACWEIJ_10125 [Lentzea sp. NPDC004789]
MSWLRRLLLLAGLVTGAWLLGGAGEANADVKVEIDHLKIEVRLPVAADVGLEVETGLVPAKQPEAPPPPAPDPRTEPPEPPVPPQPQPVVDVPVHAEAPSQHQQPPAPPPSTTGPADPAPSPQPPQPHAEPPMTGTLPQSGAGASSGGQIPVGTLPCAMRPPTTTTSLVTTEQQHAPRTVRAEEPTYSPD